MKDNNQIALEALTTNLDKAPSSYVQEDLCDNFGTQRVENIALLWKEENTILREKTLNTKGINSEICAGHKGDSYEFDAFSKKSQIESYIQRFGAPTHVQYKYFKDWKKTIDAEIPFSKVSSHYAEQDSSKTKTQSSQMGELKLFLTEDMVTVVTPKHEQSYRRRIEAGSKIPACILGENGVDRQEFILKTNEDMEFFKMGKDSYYEGLHPIYQGVESGGLATFEKDYAQEIINLEDKLVGEKFDLNLELN